MCGEYPLGAQYDKKAPFNEKPDKNVEVCVSVTYHGNFMVTVPDDYDEVDLREAVRNQITLPGDYSQVWMEDEFEVVKE